MANDTEITLVGNLVADPEMKVSTSGTSWARFAVASTPRRYDKSTGQWVDGEALFMQCTAWRQLAENVVETLSKGTRVVVTGRLRQHKWETPEGEKRSAFGVDVEDIGPSLRMATATVNKTQRGSSGAGVGGNAADDPWSGAAGHTPSF